MHGNIKKKKGHWESFDIMKGLGYYCYHLLEDGKGHIWIATGTGLSRYDGREFVNFTSKHGLAGIDVRCIHQDRAGHIWIGTTSGLSRYDGKGFVNFSHEGELSSSFIRCIHQDKKGDIWIGTNDGLSRYDSKRFVNFTKKDGLAGNQVSCVHQDREGNIWIGTDDGLSRYDGRRFVNFTKKDGLAANYINCIHQDREGHIWIGTTSGLSRYDGKRFVNFTRKDGLAGNDILCIYQNKEGNIWIGTWGNGASYYDGNEFVNFNTEDGLAHYNISDIMEDKEGHIWFACEYGGISRYDPYSISAISDESVNEVMMQDQDRNLWWGFGNVLSQFDSKEVIHHCSFEHAIYALFEDSKGQFWIGTNGGGVFICDNIKAMAGNSKLGTRNLKNLTVDNGLVGNEIWKICEDRAGNIWIGAKGGVSRYDGKRFTNFTTDDGLGINIVSIIYQDNKGWLWFGGWAGKGLTSYDGKSFYRYTTNDGLLHESTICLIEDNENNLWIGTTFGINYYNRKDFKKVYTTEDGLLLNLAQRMLQDSRGQIWIATLGGGVNRFDGKNFQALTTDDGLPSNCVTGIIEDADGSFIISTYRGVCRYMPDYKIPPLIKIDEVDTDRVYEKPEEVQISDSVKSIRIKYHGISFKTKKMRYNYILEGYDQEWKATWDEEVRYENLPIGEYTFKVIAINRDLVHSAKAAALKVTVQPDPRDLAFASLQIEVNRLRQEVGRKYHFDNIMGRSATMKQVYALLEKAIDSGLTVLITGETGTGKELAAKAIHYNSRRQDKPLLELNCGAVPKDLVASTLFGHQKGAFTGAIEDKVGLFEAAAGGTVMLDEISEMPNEAQVYLLRALQERKIQRVGETKWRHIDVRIIAVTNRNLAAEVKAGRFREDLYYRLNVFPIHLPALRDRLDDIPILSEHFLQKARLQLKKEIEGFADGIFEMLQSYSWPGNVRELENEISRAAALVEEGLKIHKYHFSPKVTQGESLIQEIISDQVGYMESVNRFRRRYIENVLREYGGNRTQAAKILGMDRANLRNLMKRLGID
jgi:DNA-binding NtrC family response regulator/ligand-binding sensor domain-containing protein